MRAKSCTPPRETHRRDAPRARSTRLQFRHALACTRRPLRPRLGRPQTRRDDFLPPRGQAEQEQPCIWSPAIELTRPCDRRATLIQRHWSQISHQQKALESGKSALAGFQYSGSLAARVESLSNTGQGCQQEQGIRKFFERPGSRRCHYHLAYSVPVNWG
jgi:hypothetical protein